jgi:hypothetical protein
MKTNIKVAREIVALARALVSADKPAKGDIVRLLSDRENFDYVSKATKKVGDKWIVETRSGEDRWIKGPTDEDEQKKIWDEVASPK